MSEELIHATETPVHTDANGDISSLEDQILLLKNKGNSALMAGHFVEAIQMYTDAISLSSKPNAILLSNRSQALLKIENYGLALEDASAAIEADPTYPKGYYRRGTVHFALNKTKDAKKDFKVVCKLVPKDKDARSRLAECDKIIKETAFAAAITSEETAPLSETYDVKNIPIESSYDGPHPSLDESSGDNLFLPGCLPRDFVMAAIERFRNQKLIHKHYVAQLLISCVKYFGSLPSLIDISLPKCPPEHCIDAKPRVTVCGDTHGQFYDVLNIFSLNGYPSRSNPFIFNGDYVDRGSFSVEVILTFLLFKICDPESIHLTRGNHETKNMNRIYGFEGEVKAKYDDKIFQLFLEVFGHLPLAAVIEKSIFVTHGGIPVEVVSLDDIRKIKRGCEPPESGIMSDLLWADPQPHPGKSPSKRGVGFSFGPDITNAFLEKNGLSLLVRSHEVKDDGYQVEHGGKTITIFSAPNYCDSTGNKGAFIHFDESLEPKFTQFEAVPHPNVRPMAYSAGMGSLFM